MKMVVEDVWETNLFIWYVNSYKERITIKTINVAVALLEVSVKKI